MAVGCEVIGSIIACTHSSFRRERIMEIVPLMKVALLNGAIVCQRKNWQHHQEENHLIPKLICHL